MSDEKNQRVRNRAMSVTAKVGHNSVPVQPGLPRSVLN